MCVPCGPAVGLGFGVRVGPVRVAVGGTRVLVEVAVGEDVTVGANGVGLTAAVSLACGPPDVSLASGPPAVSLAREPFEVAGTPGVVVGKKTGRLGAVAVAGRMTDGTGVGKPVGTGGFNNC